MDQNRRNFNLRFAETLEPEELLISGGENDPLEVEITTVNEEEQLERALGDPNKPVPPRVDFRLIRGKIIPELSSGRRNEIYSIHLLPIRLFDRSSKLVFVNVCPMRMCRGPTRNSDHARIHGRVPLSLFLRLKQN